MGGITARADHQSVGGDRAAIEGRQRAGAARLKHLYDRRRAAALRRRGDKREVRVAGEAECVRAEIKRHAVPGKKIVDDQLLRIFGIEGVKRRPYDHGIADPRRIRSQVRCRRPHEYCARDLRRVDFLEPRDLRIDNYVEGVGFEDAVGRAAVVVAAAVVIEHRHVLGRALEEAHTNAKGMQPRGVLLCKVRHFAMAEKVEDLLLGHKDIVAAAIHRGARLHHHVARAAACVRVRRHVEPAHHAPSVQPCLMQAEFLGVIARLRDEVGCAHHLAGEVVVLHEWLEGAGFADGLGAMLVFAAHASPFPSIQSRRFAHARVTRTHRRRRPRRKHGAASE